MGVETSVGVLLAVVALVGWLTVSQYQERRREGGDAVITHDRRPIVFVSYRRTDGAAAGRIVDALGPHYRIARDVDSIEPGVDHRASTSQLIETADVVLVILGPGFMESSESGRTRLHDEGDFVRPEIRQALAKGRGLIPVLIGGVDMPAEGDLPADIREFAFRNALRVRDDPFFHGDCAALASSLDDVARKIRDAPEVR